MKFGGKFTSYLTFSRNCEEAFALYKSVFGGEYVFLIRYGDLPSEFVLDEPERNLIMHVELSLGESGSMYGVDLLPSGGRVIPGNNMAIMVTLPSREEFHRVFQALSPEGTVIREPQRTSWSELFTHFSDKFGIQWVVNLEEPIIKDSDS